MSGTGASGRSVPQQTIKAPGGNRPARPKLDLNLPPVVQETSSDTDDTDNILLMLDKLRRAKHLLAESKEKKRKREILTEAMNNFYRDSTNTMQKYVKLCQEKKKQLIGEGEKLRSEISSLLERLDRRIETYEKFVTTQSVRLDEAERQLQVFEHKIRRDFNETDRTLDSELEMMRTQIDDKLEEIKRALNRTAKKAKKKDHFAHILRQILDEY